MPNEHLVMDMVALYFEDKQKIPCPYEWKNAESMLTLAEKIIRKELKQLKKNGGKK